MNTSEQAFKEVIKPVDGKYGAPMGRYSNDESDKPTDRRVFNRQVPMSSCGAYDKGGAYWGIGSQLRVEYTADLSYIRFYRKQYSL